MDPVLISLVSACTALVASIAGPLITLNVAKRQINATVLSANRQKWINAMRDTLAELISLLISVQVFKSGWKGDWNEGIGAVAAEPALLAKVERIMFLRWRILLLTNPLEAEHRELSETIESALQHIRSSHYEEEVTRAHVEKLTRLAQAILKREWERVKRGN